MTEESCTFAESGSAVGLDLVHVESFITALVAAGYAAGKIADKRRIARKFVIWTQSRGILPDEVGDHHLVQYLETTRPTSKARSAFKRSVLRAPLGHLRREGVVAEAAAVRDDVTPHTLRHSAAMSLLQRGVDPTVIALWLGHESSETTFMYVHADMQLKERALAHAGPSGQAPARFRPSDELLAFLDGL
jgi:site-specific recombinase XerD